MVQVDFSRFCDYSRSFNNPIHSNYGFLSWGNELNTSQDGYSLIYNAICDLCFKLH